MNFEICKKCALKSFNYIFQLNPDFNIILKATKSNCNLYSSNMHLFKFLEDYRLHKRNIFIEIYHFERDESLEPDKNICPYYMEHLMEKLNKEKAVMK